MRVLSFILMTFLVSCSFSKKLVTEQVALNVMECDQKLCISLEYINKFEKPICIKNTYYPYDGNLYENAFRIIDLRSGKRIEYRLIEPSLVTDEKHAVLVRLLPKGASINSTIRISDYYEVEKNGVYRIEYGAQAFFCDLYGDEESKELILLSGSIENRK